jgi:radical SAM protein with 4Fe4S-binding SPASM domain
MKSGIKCYQNGLNVNKPNMSFENFKRIIDEIEGKAFSIALGGRGDSEMHENFGELVEYASSKNIAVAMTSSGIGMTPEKAAICKKYMGAVAISAYSRISKDPIIAYRKALEEPHTAYTSLDDIPAVFTLAGMNQNCIVSDTVAIINGKEYNLFYNQDELSNYMNGEYELYRVYNEVQKPNYTLNGVKMLLDAGVTTNIHYVLSNTTIDEAILRLKYNGFPAGLNAVIFLLHKPVGLGDESDVLQYDDPRLVEFFAEVDKKHPFKIGFDSCTVPAILNFSKHINMDSIDTCEAGRFSMYITSDMIALPCSFDNVNQKYAFDLRNGTIQDAWDSDAFNRFRNSFHTSCKGCAKRSKCLGGCPLEPSITLCNSEHKSRED